MAITLESKKGSKKGSPRRGRKRAPEPLWGTENASSDKRGRKYPFIHAQFLYALIYSILTFLMLIALNLHTNMISKRLFFESKFNTMTERGGIVAAEIAGRRAVNRATVERAMEEVKDLQASQVIVTDAQGRVLYSAQPVEELPGELRAVMAGEEGFSWDYARSLVVARIATPITIREEVRGYVYLEERDSTQGILIHSLQQSIIMGTAILELTVIVMSILFTRIFSIRFRRIVNSRKIINRGDASYKVHLGGNDELTFLGREFNDLTDKLQRSEEKRTQFVSDASHELRTPLASIKLLADSILQNDMDTATVREFVTDIGSEADRLNRMTQKLLTLSHIESQQDGVCEIVNMAPTLERVTRMLRLNAEEAGICYELDLRDDTPILILEDDLYQIAYNLVENGIKYNVPGGTLRVELYRDGNLAMMRVTDTGVGIPEDALPHVFERFYRVDKGRARATGGSGLGLSIVKSMVERNRGTISVESAVGRGTTFTVAFPVYEVEKENKA